MTTPQNIAEAERLVNVIATHTRATQNEVDHKCDVNLVASLLADRAERDELRKVNAELTAELNRLKSSNDKTAEIPIEAPGKDMLRSKSVGTEKPPQEAGAPVGSQGG